MRNDLFTMSPRIASDRFETASVMPERQWLTHGKPFQIRDIGDANGRTIGTQLLVLEGRDESRPRDNQSPVPKRWRGLFRLCVDDKCQGGRPPPGAMRPGKTALS